MKHPINLTLILIIMFLSAQLMGLLVVREYVDIEASHETGTTINNVEEFQRIGVEPPSVGNESLSFIFIFISVLIGTVLILLIIKLKKGKLWKVWYLFAVFFALLVAINPFMFKLLSAWGVVAFSPYLATIAISLGLSLWKILKPNMYVHNLTEILIYGGIAALLVPVLNLLSATVLLLLISIYDAYAVWKSRHMVTLAEFQKTTNLFAGLYLPYGKSQDSAKTPKQIPGKKNKKEEQISRSAEKKADKIVLAKEKEGTPGSAILGGGDIAFPLLFAGTVMKTTGSLVYPLIIVAVTTAALAILLIRANKGKYYPAMPFLSLGCFVGAFLTWIANLIF